MAIWDFAGRLANFGVTFVVGIALTRILSPSEFGAYAIVLSVISLSSIFVDLGFRSAVIQAPNPTDQQLSTIFYINLLLGLGLIGFFSIVAGGIERFYEVEGLRLYIIGASLLFGINALALVPGALLQKELELKKLSVINTTAAVVSGVVAIYLALIGYKVWALIAQQLVSASVIFLGVAITIRWRPHLQFALSSIRQLWAFGSRLFVSGLADTIFSRLDVFVIGKMFPIQTLGFYNRAQSLDSFVKNFAASSTTSVAFPVIAKMAGDLPSVRTFYSRCLNIISFLAFLLIGVLFLTCFDIVTILFTERWETVGYYFRIMALTGFVYPLSALMVTLLAARGNSGAFLKLEIIKKAILLPVYLTFLFGGIYIFLIALGTGFLAALLVNTRFVARELSITIKEQLTAIARYGLVAGPVCGVVFLIGTFLQNHFIHLFACSSLFTAGYLLFCYQLNLPGFREIFDRVITFYNDKRHANLSSAA